MPNTEGSRRGPYDAKMGSCCNNPNVWCEAINDDSSKPRPWCKKCGWNPEVEARRKAENKRKLEGRCDIHGRKR